MSKVIINGKEIEVSAGMTIIQACEIAGVEIPRFCYHEKLKVAGNCRMCLVEVVGAPPKPVASCAMPISDGMQILTNSEMVKKAREGVMEFMLANHPLDCPICDQGGECDLQDQAFQYGKGNSAYHEHKRAVKDKNMGPLVKTVMTRCIHCTRCVRFIEDVAGTCEIGGVNRGESMEITTYLEKNLTSELSANVIDLCPVGALTSKPYSFKARSWELQEVETIDVMDSFGANILINYRGNEIMRILPKKNEEINEEWISDKARFCYDGLKYQRLDKAYIKKNGKLESVNIEDAYGEVVKKIKSHKPEEISALSGNLSSVEDVFSLKELLKNLNVDSFDCRLKNEKLDSNDRSSYLFNTCISNVNSSDLCLLIGLNPRKDSPVLNSRIRKRFVENKLPIASIGCNEDLTYRYENLGDDLSIIDEILEGKHGFCQKLQSSSNPMIIVGNDIASRKDGDVIINKIKLISEKFNVVKEGWNGFNFLAKSTGLINGLEVDFVGKKSCSEILDKISKQEIKVIILHEVDDDIDFSKLANAFVIYVGSHGDNGAKIADVIIPSYAFSEKEAMFINIEGRPQITKPISLNIGEAKNAWEIYLEIANRLNINLGFKDFSELKLKISQNYSFYKNLNKVIKSDWVKSKNLENKIDNPKFLTKSFDFYLTNPIARASRILNKCSIELNQNFSNE